MAKMGYGMRSSHGTSGGRGTWGPASQCHRPPPKVGGLRQAVLAITWQSFAEHRLDGRQDDRVGHRPLGEGRSVEHLVAELGPVRAGSGVDLDAGEDVLDLGREERRPPPG